MPILALLLDLDDTLLINDMSVFMEPYFRALTQRMSPLIPMETFVPALLKGTHAMQANDGTDGTNAEVFEQVFFGQVDADPEAILPAFEAFYRNEFQTLATLTEPDPVASDLVAEARSQGLQVAITTQPLFPLIAIEARLAWAGVGIAMGNAIDEVKRVSDWVAPSMDADGAAVAIERFCDLSAGG